MGRILIIGANGQIGSELVAALADLRGEDNVIAADLAPSPKPHRGQFVALDVLDERRLLEVVDRYAIDEVYQLAALLSAKGEEAPLKTWTLNVNGLLNVLELARRKRISRVFWPSSIAAFGVHSPAVDTPQFAVMDPGTIYGITKLAGERLCEYYFTKFGVDVRSLRFPGVISHKTPPGGGTTDYAIAIFQAAKRGDTYRCFLDANTRLPMIYMPDALRATLELMQADTHKVRVRSSYNLAGVSFSPREIAEAIRRHHPEFEVTYAPDFRQAIAETWPRSIDDAHGQRDWGWKPRFDLERLTDDMLENVPLAWTEQTMA